MSTILNSKRFVAIVSTWIDSIIANGGAVENESYIDQLVSSNTRAKYINIAGCYGVADDLWMSQVPIGADFAWNRDSIVNNRDPLLDLREIAFHRANISNVPGEPLPIPVALLEPQATGRTTNLFTMNGGSVQNTETDYFGAGLDRITCRNISTVNVNNNEVKSFGSFTNPGLVNQEISLQMYLGYDDSRYLSFHGALVEGYFDIDLQTGVVTSPDNSFINMKSVPANDGQGWLVSMTSLKVTASGTGNNVTLSGGPVTAHGDNSTIPGKFLQGLFQVEINPFPTSLINGSGNIRFQDEVAPVTDASFFNDQEGVWQFQIENYASGTFGLHHLSGVANDRFTVTVLGDDITIFSKSSLGGDGSAVITIDSSIANEFIVVWHKVTEVFRVYLNGVFNTHVAGVKAPQNMDTIIWSSTSGDDRPSVIVRKQLLWDLISEAELDLGYSLGI